MEELLKILILEDSITDAELLQRVLLKANMRCEFHLATDKNSFLEALEELSIGLIISDNSLPQFDATEALKITRRRFYQIPFILVTGTVSEEFAVEIIKLGADDYILKDRMARLPGAIDAAIKKRKALKELADYKYAIDQSAIVSITDEKGIILYSNENFCKISKYNAEELIGRHHRIVNSGYHSEEFFRMMWVTINKGKIWKGEIRNKAKDGMIYWVDTTIVPLLDGRGKIQQFLAIRTDITQRKIAEEKLISNERRFRALIENSADGIVMSDADSNILYQSPSVARILGYEMDERIGKKVMDYVHPDDREGLYNLFNTLRTDANNPMPFQYRFLHKSGNYVWLEGVVTNLIDDPDVNAYVANYRDITERKIAEEEIKISHERFEMVVSATNDIIWDWDIATNKFWWNENYFSHFGYNKTNNVIDVTSWQNGVHPDDRERVIAGIRSCIANHQTFWTDEYRFIKADGNIAFVLDCGYILYDEKSKPYRMVGAMLDITGRRKAEEELKQSFIEKNMLAERMSTILNTLPANIALLDKKGIIMDVNAAWKKFALENGYKGTDFNIGDDYIKISKRALGDEEIDGKKAAQGIQDVLKNILPEFVYEYPCHAPNLKRWFRMIVTPLKGKEFAGVVIMHIDISEVRKLEQERMESKMEEQKKISQAILKAQEKERSAIGAELHDNVNQILAGTNIFLSIAKKNPEKSTEYIESSMQNIQQAIEANRKIAHALVAPDFEEIQLLEMLYSLTDIMLKKANIDVHIDSSVLKEALLSDEQKLSIYRIAQEQCTNIIKYAEAKSVKILLSTVDDVFKMVIADNGKGMEPGKKAGGIGLRNIKGRLSIFNGEADIVTAKGKGFTLEVKIPL